MLIRRLEVRDLSGLLALYEHLHRDDEPLPERPTVDSVWADIMASANYRYYGGFVDGNLVSSCTLAIVPNYEAAGFDRNAKQAFLAFPHA